MDKTAGPGSPSRGGRLGAEPRRGVNLHLQLALIWGNQRSRTESYRHSQGLLYATQKRKKGEVLEQGEKRSRDPRSHPSFRPLRSLSYLQFSPLGALGALDTMQSGSWPVSPHPQYLGFSQACSALVPRIYASIGFANFPSKPRKQACCSSVVQRKPLRPSLLRLRF